MNDIKEECKWKTSWRVYESTVPREARMVLNENRRKEEQYRKANP